MTFLALKKALEELDDFNSDNDDNMLIEIYNDNTKRYDLYVIDDVQHIRGIRGARYFGVRTHKLYEP